MLWPERQKRVRADRPASAGRFDGWDQAVLEAIVERGGVCRLVRLARAIAPDDSPAVLRRTYLRLARTTLDGLVAAELVTYDDTEGVVALSSRGWTVAEQTVLRRGSRPRSCPTPPGRTP